MISLIIRKLAKYTIIFYCSCCLASNIDDLGHLGSALSLTNPERQLARLENNIQDLTRFSIKEQLLLLNAALNLSIMLDKIKPAESYVQRIQHLLDTNKQDFDPANFEHFQVNRALLLEENKDIDAAKQLLESIETQTSSQGVVLARILYAQAYLCDYCPAYSIAERIEKIERASELYKQADDWEGHAYSQLVLLKYLRSSQDLERIVATLGYLQQLGERVGDPALSASILIQQLRHEYNKANGKQGKVFAEQLEALDIVGYPQLRNKVYFILATYFLRHTKEHRKALKYFQSINDWLKQHDPGHGLYYQTTHSVGEVYAMLNEYDKAIAKFYQAVEIADSLSWRYYQGRSMEHVARSQISMGRYEEGIKSYELALALYDQVNENEQKVVEHSKVSVFIALGQTYYGLSERESLNREGYREKAIFYYDQALNSVQQTGENFRIYYVTSLRARLIRDEQEFAQRKPTLVEALEYFKQQENIGYQIQVLVTLGIVTYKLALDTRSDAYFQAAARYYQQALALAVKISRRDSILHYYRTLSDIYKEQGDFEQAVAMMDKYLDYRNQINEQEREKNFSELNTKYETEKKQKQIELLNKEKLLNEAKLKQQASQRNLIVASAILLVLLVVFAAYFYFSRRETRRVRQQVVDRTHQLNEKTNKLEALFDRYVTLYQNFSHEFRTPINIIAGNLHQLKLVDNEQRKVELLQTLERNTQGLAHLVEQVVDLSRPNRDPQAVVTKQPGQLLEDMLARFLSTIDAENKKLVITIKDEAAIAISSEAFQRVVVNLISNAIKYTQAGAKIEVSMQISTNQLVLIVRDDGIGIASDQLEKIFQRFHRCYSPLSKEVSGTGLGLAIVKELIDSVGGSIEVASELGRYTQFQVALPLADSMALEHIDSEQINTVVLEHEVSYLGNRVQNAPSVQTKRTEEAAEVILIVEDNIDMQRLLVDFFDSKYQVECASDGEEGLAKAHQVMPDIVISDIDMPLKDGFELLADLKKDAITCHIPVLLLTAKAGIEHRITGWQYEADGYINKPFNHEELHALCRSLINNRLLMKNAWLLNEAIRRPNSTEPYENVEQVAVEFIARLNAFIDDNVDDAGLKVQQIANHFAMSVRSFQRKIKAMTGQTVSDYMRIYRLEKSKQLLILGKPVTTVAYMVGFNSPSYFSAAYKNYFKETPSHTQSR